LTGRYDEAQVANERASRSSRSRATRAGSRRFGSGSASNTLTLGNVALAREQLEESLALHRKLGSPRGEAESDRRARLCRPARRDFARALALFEESEKKCAAIGFTWWEASMASQRADCEFELGRVEEAERKGRRGLELSRQIGDRQSMVYTVGFLARNAAGRGDITRAGRLWGALEAEENVPGRSVGGRRRP
jgi:tetratricopeptide (TPR) repeat protein